MANEEHLEILSRGVSAWNQWREKNLYTTIDLSNASLSGTFLARANLSEANLNGADLDKADLSMANLSWARLHAASLRSTILASSNLSRARLHGADLRLAYMNEAYLVEADLSNAKLDRTELSHANLKKANLSEAILKRTILSRASFSGTALSKTALIDVDLTEIENLSEAVHLGPSYIDMHTIYGVGGKVPDVFLRGVGLSDELIRYARSLSSEYHSIFISYSSKDEDFAKKLHADLQSNGVRCWFAPKDMKIGDNIRDTIDRQIQTKDKFLVILSKNSIESGWVEDETETAFEKERKNRKRSVLYPIKIDESIDACREAWAAKLRRWHIGDFIAWNNDKKYQEALERLLRDLKPGLRN